MNDNDDLVRSLLEERGNRLRQSSYDPPDTPSLYTQHSPRSYTFDSPQGGVPDVPQAPYYYTSGEHYDSFDHSVMSNDESQDDPYISSPRRNLSILGPKMRIHSRAPWEMDPDTYNSSQSAYDDENGSTDSRSISGTKNKSRIREKGEKLLKGVSRGAVSPRVGMKPLLEPQSASNYQKHSKPFLATSSLPSASRSITPVSPSTTQSSLGSPVWNGSFKRPQPQYGSGEDVPPTPPPKQSSNTLHEPESTSQDVQSLWEQDSMDSHTVHLHPFANPDNLRQANRISHFITTQDSNAIDYESTGQPSLSAVNGDMQMGISHENIAHGGNAKQNATILEGQRARSTSRTAREGPASLKGQIFVPHREGHRLRVISQEASSSSTTLPLAPPRRTVKQKRSGLLRLFNKEKTQNSEDDELRPPLPQLTNPSQNMHLISASAQDGPRQALHQSLNHDLSHHPRDAFTFPSMSNRSSPRLNLHTPKRILVERYPSGVDYSQPASAPATATTFTSLSLRPVSSLFSEHFNNHILPMTPLASHSESLSSRSSSTNVDTPLTSPLPLTPQQVNPYASTYEKPFGVEDKDLTISTLRKEILETRRVWESQVSEFERMITDLKDEVDQLRRVDYCESCGRGANSASHDQSEKWSRQRGGFRSGTRTLFGGG